MMHFSCLTKCLKRILIPYDDFTTEVIFGVPGKKERHRRSFFDKEIVGLVTVMYEHGVFLDAFKLTQMITRCGRFCRLGGVVAVEVAFCNALLVGLGRERVMKD